MNADELQIPKSDRVPLRQPPFDEGTRSMIENAAFSGLSPINLRLLLAHHPRLAKRFQALAHTVLFDTDLGLRIKEIAIIRTTALTGAEYPWGMHVAIYGERCNFDDRAVRDLTLAVSWSDLDDDRWTDDERLAVRIADELHLDSTISEESWKQASAIWQPPQFLELVFAIGTYHLASFFLNSAAVPLEIGQARFPAGYGRKIGR